jgi:hypothetical protein
MAIFKSSIVWEFLYSNHLEHRGFLITLYVYVYIYVCVCVCVCVTDIIPWKADTSRLSYPVSFLPNKIMQHAYRQMSTCDLYHFLRSIFSSVAGIAQSEQGLGSLDKLT